MTTKTQEVFSQSNASDQRALDRSFLHAIAWTGGVKFTTQLLAWGSTLIVARILTPVDFGIVSLGTVFFNLVSLVSEFGVGTAVVTLRDLSDGQLSQLNGLAVALGCLGFGTTLVAAYPMGHFFKSPQLPPVMIVLGIGFVITSFQAVPASLLQKELRFKLLALIDSVRGLLIPLATVSLALAGLRYWALVFGSLLSGTVGTAATLIVRRQAIRIPSYKKLAPAVNFSFRVLIARVCWYVYTDSDFLVAGRTLGQAPLGGYTMAWTLAYNPMDKITTLMSSVMPAFFSALQTEIAALKRYALNLTEGLALLTFPITIGMGLVAGDFVRLVLGPKWELAIVPLAMLAFSASLRSISPVLSHVLIVTGEVNFGMWTAIVTAVALPIAFYIGSRRGIVGIATVWLIACPLLLIVAYWRAAKKIELTTAEYFRSLQPALTGSGLMIATILALKVLWGPGWPLVLRFVVEVLLGAFVYIGSILVLHRGRLGALMRRIRSTQRLQD